MSRTILVLFASLVALLSTSLALPTSNTTTTSVPTLRILPLGNSITYGYLSSTGNGYRAPLLLLLSTNYPSTPTTYIGSVASSGSMANNANEGHPGAVITEIATFAQNDKALGARPNVILLMAGTNDMNNPTDPATAPQRLGALIDLCIRSCPDAVVVVAQLTPAADNAVETRIESFNAQIPGLVKDRQGQGKKVVVVDMSATVKAADLKDGLHPTDGGYEKMASVWMGGIWDAVGKGWVSAPD